VDLKCVRNIVLETKPCVGASRNWCRSYLQGVS